jgi:hypothetical protein
MPIKLNPYAQAELEVEQVLKYVDVPAVDGAAATRIAGLKARMMAVVQNAITAERLTMGEHEDCGEDNPEGLAGKCKCYCHKGHWKHVWKLVAKNPIQAPDGVTYYLLYECKWCPDMQMRVIKTAFDKAGKHTLVNLTYLVRGDMRVLSVEEWLERNPKPGAGELKREAEL